MMKCHLFRLGQCILGNANKKENGKGMKKIKIPFDNLYASEMMKCSLFHLGSRQNAP